MAKASERSATRKPGKDAGGGRKGAAEPDTKAPAKSSPAKKAATGSRSNSPAKSTKKSNSTKPDTKKAGTKKADGKKADSKKPDSKKADAKKSGSARKSGTQAATGKSGAKAPAGTAKAGRAGSGKAGPGGKSGGGKAGPGGKSGGGKARPTANTPDIPSTLERSPDPKAARTFVAAHDAAVEQYGRGERATRTALAAVKHSYEKVGDHWEPKDEKGPSDSRAASPRGRSGTSAGGVDATATRAHLYVLAQRLDITGRSRMSKEQLVEAVQKANDAATARARR